jgi:phosphoribosylglycinamide formyltransferase-1
MKRIAIFASGSGTNAENLVQFFRTNPAGRVEMILTNRPDAGVIHRAKTLGVETILFDREQFYETGAIVKLLQERDIEFIVLAGFLWLVPAALLNVYRGRVVNIHPALLPKYGGKGMYGNRVHEAVIASGDKNSGITIHHVNQAYDEGDVIFQASCPVMKDDTADSLASRIHQLEYKHFPAEIEKILNQF